MTKTIESLNAKSFPDQTDAVHALFMEGFNSVDNVRGLFRSADGLVDAVIKQRFSDNRFYIVLFA